MAYISQFFFRAARNHPRFSRQFRFRRVDSFCQLVAESRIPLGLVESRRPTSSRQNLAALWRGDAGTGTDSVVRLRRTRRVVNSCHGTLCITLWRNASGDQYLLVERFLCVLRIPLCSSGMKSRLCGLLRTKYFYAILNCFSLCENVTGFQLFLKWLCRTFI